MGCTTVDFKNCVPDWPSLKVIEYELAPKELQAACSKYGGIFETVMACTEWNFDKGTITSYYPENPPEWMLKHERGHQQGCDHYNSTYMWEHWNEWKASKRVSKTQ